VLILISNGQLCLFFSVLISNYGPSKRWVLIWGWWGRELKEGGAYYIEEIRHSIVLNEQRGTVMCGN